MAHLKICHTAFFRQTMSSMNWIFIQFSLKRKESSISSSLFNDFLIIFLFSLHIYINVLASGHTYAAHENWAKLFIVLYVSDHHHCMCIESGNSILTDVMTVENGTSYLDSFSLKSGHFTECSSLHFEVVWQPWIPSSRRGWNYFLLCMLKIESTP